MTTRTISKRLSTALIAASLFAMTAPVQANVWTDLLFSTADAALSTKQINEYDNSDEGQAEVLKETKEKTGVYYNEAANQRVQRVVDTLTMSPEVKRKYVAYVNPEEDVNAFMALARVMSVNKGTLDMMDDSELASILGHELGHGEHKDIVNGFKKAVQVQTLAKVAGGGEVSGLSALAGNYLNKQVFSVKQESNADLFGATLLEDSPYNIGGGASAMVKIRNKYGELYVEGLAQVTNPNNHPKTTNRIQVYNGRIYEFSGNHVYVNGTAVVVNGDTICTPVSAGNYTGESRAYLMAGKLSRLYHDKQITETTVATANGAVVVVSGENIITATSSADATDIANKLTVAFKKPAGKDWKKIKDSVVVVKSKK